MTDALRPADTRASLAWAVLAAVGLGWGATGLLGKLATETGHGSLALAFWQTAIGVVLFTAGLRLAGLALPLSRRHLVFYAVCGLIGTALPHTLGYVSIRHLPVGVQTLLLSTVPMGTFLLSVLVGEERFRARRAAGLALGLLAVLMIALPEAGLPEPGQAAWLVLPVLIALSYASENVYISQAKPADLQPLQVMCGLTWAAAAMLLPAAIAEGGLALGLAGDGAGALGRPEAALAASSVLHVLSYFGLVWLIGHAGPVFASQVGYVVTASGVAWGMIVLGERHSLWVWGALLLIFAGLALVRPRRHERAEAEPETGGGA